MRSVLGVVTLSLCLVGASACTPARTSSSFSSGETMRAQPVAMGTVVAVRAVDIRPGQTHLGTAVGAVMGGLAGSQIGGDRTSNAAGAVGGATAGGALGSGIQGARVTPGVEVTVALENGQTVAIIQPGDPRDFREGDHVRVVGTAENARVTR